MLTRSLLTSCFCLQLTAAASSQVLFRAHGDLWRVPARAAGLLGAVETLLAGPSPRQRSEGITSAIPAGTRLISLQQRQGQVWITLGPTFLSFTALEDAIEQITKTVLRAGNYRTVFLSVQDDSGRVHPLNDLLRQRQPRVPKMPSAGAPAPESVAAVTGALAGKTIVISPGHGYYWHTRLGWTTQRPTIDGLTEDIHTNEICIRYLIPALENMGARVISCRERGEIVHEVLGDNGQGKPRYAETGSWTHLGNGGYAGGSYRTAFSTTGKPTATATWTLPLPADGSYPVYVFFRAGAFTNTIQDAGFTIHHSGGTARIRIDQTQDDRRWVHLGDFWFTRARGARVVLDNQSAAVGKLVIADAVRVGGGRGSISRGGRTSGKPRWQECSRYWTQFAGAPSSVYNPVSTGQDNSDDVTARPRYAEWRGAHAYISLHTNAGGGSGTSSFIYNGGATKGSAALQSTVQSQLVKDIRAFYDSAWLDRGRKSANFGEVRLLKTMPGLLVELAFHDTKNSKDHRALHDPRFRYIAGRAYARGVLRYFNSNAPFPPEPPVGLRVIQDGKRGLLVAFEPVFATSAYSIEQSPDGKGFVEVAQTTSTSWSTGPLPHGTMLSFRVRALNQGGRSFPTEALTAGTSHTKRADLLLVEGFDRLDRWVKHPENTRDYLRLHGAAIRASGEFSLGFDAASNEAVMSGRVKLKSYRAVDWASGEESTQHETFSTLEQGLVRSYLQQGGRLLVSGAEIGWDLDHKGSTSDRSFYRSVLGTRYLRDDANTYAFTASSNSSTIFSGLSQGRFDDGTSGTYNVDYADVIAPADSKSTACLSYAGGTGGGAAIQRIDGTSRVVNLGFPLETITDPVLRAAVMTRALRFLLTPRPLEADPEVLLGKTLPLKITVPNDKGLPYVLAASLQVGNILLPGDVLIPLTPDVALDLSLVPNNDVFVGFRGNLDLAGRGAGSLVVPNLSAARGVKLYFTGITATSGGVFRTVLPWVRVLVK